MSRFFIILFLLLPLALCGKKNERSDMKLSSSDIEKIYFSVTYSAYLVSNISSFIMLMASKTDECITSDGNQKIFNCSSTSPAVFGSILVDGIIYFLNLTVVSDTLQGNLSGTAQVRGEGLMLSEISIKITSISDNPPKNGEIKINSVLFSGIENGFSAFASNGKVSIYWTDIVEMELKDFRYSQYTDPNTIYTNVVFYGDLNFPADENLCIRNISGRFDVSLLGVVSPDGNIPCPVEGSIKFGASIMDAKSISCDSRFRCSTFIF